MSAEEINAAVLDCARYGEDEDMKALIEVHGGDVNTVDAGGNTALHKASANGHVECIKVLLSNGARRCANESGNFPEHWAAQNGHTAALQLLLESFTDLDVLQKNGFGRSVLTEAFQGKNSDCIALCLNHHTAAEERLIPGGPGVSQRSERAADGSTSTVFRMDGAGTGAGAGAGAAAGAAAAGASGGEGSGGAAAAMEEEGSDDEDDAGGSAAASAGGARGVADAVLHEFWFYDEQMGQGGEGASSSSSNSTTSPGPRILCRELPIAHADTPFGNDAAPENDTTGLAIWPASILLSQWVIDKFRGGLGASVGTGAEGAVVMELGAGCGLPGLAAAVHLQHCGSSGTVYITDIHADSIDNAKHNTLINGYSEVSTVPAAANASSTAHASTSTYTRSTGTTSSTVVVQHMSWNDISTYPPCCKPNPATNSTGASVDLLLGSDLVYEVRVLQYLVPTVLHVLKPGGRFMYIAPEEGSRQGMSEFIQCLQQLGIENDKGVGSASGTGTSGEGAATKKFCIRLVDQFDCPEKYYRNPFPADDDAAVDRDDRYVLHFYDLAAKRRHICYEFQKVEV